MNAQAQHTPGPWNIDGGEGEHGDLYIWRDDSNDKWKDSHAIAEVYGHGARRAVVEADARLIAAAPDLLEALRNYIKLDLSQRSGCSITEEDWQECYLQARAAFRKASAGV